MSIKRFTLGLMVLLMTLQTSGCAVSRMYNLTAKENACIIVYIDGIEFSKEGIDESQEPNFDIPFYLIPK